MYEKYEVNPKSGVCIYHPNKLFLGGISFVFSQGFRLCTLIEAQQRLDS